MQEISYIKMIFVIMLVFITIVIGVVAVVAYQLVFSGAFERHELSEQKLAEIEDEIAQLDSVMAFKEAYPDHRENVENAHQVSYLVQSRNENTGNILSLNVVYSDRSRGEYEVTESLVCIPPETPAVKGPDFSRMIFNEPDLFIVESIQNASCLDDDYVNRVIIIDDP